MRLSLVAALLAFLNSPAAAVESPAALKFADAVTQTVRASGALSNLPADYKAKFDAQLQRTLKDANCHSQGAAAVCPAATSDSLDAAAPDLQALQDLVKDEQDRQAALKAAAAQKQTDQFALNTARVNFAAQATKVLAAIPLVKDQLARNDYSRKLAQQVGKDGCTVYNNVYNCAGSNLDLDKLAAESDGLKALLADINADNTNNPRPAALKSFSQAANQVEAALAKMLSAGDRKDFQQKLDQKIGGNMGADGCAYVNGSYDCSSSPLKLDDVNKEIAFVQTMLEAVNAANADPRPALLKQLTQAAGRLQSALPSLRDRNVHDSLAQKLAQLMTADGCRQVSGAYDCSQATVKTEKLEGEIDAVNSLTSALSAAYAADPAVVSRQQLMTAANNAVGGLTNVQDPARRAGMTKRISDTLTKDGCTPVNAYWDCTKAAAPGTLDQDAETMRDLLANMKSPEINAMDAQSDADLGGLLAQIARVIAPIPNADDVKSLTAKLAAVAAEGGCQAQDPKYDCSKTTYNQFQKAMPDAKALLPVAAQTAAADGPLADHVKAAATAATVRDLGRQLSPQNVRDSFNASWLAALNNAKCSATASDIDCTKATAAQLVKLNSDLAALQNQAQGLQAKQNDDALKTVTNANGQKIVAQVTGILNATDKMIDGAKISDDQKQPLYDKVSAMRDQLESGKLLNGGQMTQQTQGPSAAGVIGAAVGGQLLGSTIGSLASGGSSGTLSAPVPVQQATALQAWVQAQIAVAMNPALKH